MKSVEQVLKEIEQGKIAHSYLLVGEEKFFHDQVIKALSAKIFPDRGGRDLNEITLYGTENTQSQVLSQLSAYPMLADRKLVIVREFQKMKIQDEETFFKYLSKPPKFSVLVLSSGEDVKNRIFKKLKELTTVVNCRPIYENKMPAWVRQCCQSLGWDITPEAAHFLVTNVGANILTLKNEVEKLISFKAEKSTITLNDVQETSGMFREVNVFALQHALAQKNLRQSIKISRQLQETGVEPTMVNAVLFAFFRKVLSAASLKRQGNNVRAIAQKMHLSEYQMRDIQEALKTFTFSQLKKVIRHLHLFDLAQKGLGDPSSASLEILCYKICRT